MDTALEQLTVFLAGGIEVGAAIIVVAAAIIVGFAAIEATLGAFPLFIPRRTLLGDEVEIIRLRLGRPPAAVLAPAHDRTLAFQHNGRQGCVLRYVY